MKNILFIILLLLTGCKASDGKTTPTQSIQPSVIPTQTHLTTDVPIISSTPSTLDNSSDEYKQCDDLLSIDTEVTIDNTVEPIILKNPVSIFIDNEITVQKLTDPYYRIYRTYTISYDFTYQKNNQIRNATLEIINYRNHPDAYSNNVYECTLEVPESDNETKYKFYGLPSNDAIYIFIDDKKTEPLYFTETLQKQIIDHLQLAYKDINTLDQQNLDFTYKYVASKYNLTYFISRTYYPHQFIEYITSDYLYYPDCDLSFFKQSDPVLEDVVYYEPESLSRGYILGYYKMVNVNKIITGINNNSNTLSIAILNEQIISEAGINSNCIIQTIDLNTNEIIDYYELLDIHNISIDKVNDFFTNNQSLIFTDGSHFANLLPQAEGNTFIYNDSIYFILLERGEHPGYCFIKLPLEDFKNNS